MRQLVAAAAALAAAALTIASTTPVSAERHLTAGPHHTCRVLPNGAAQCVGDEFTAGSTRAIVPTNTGITFVAITAADAFTCGLATNGTMTCWGDFPGTAPDPSTIFVHIHAGSRHVCGLQEDGTVLCYGAPNAGVTTVPAGTYQSVSTGFDLACAVGVDNSLTCWGGASANPILSSLPVITDALRGSVGDAHACYITTARGVSCWGDNGAGQTTVPADVNTRSGAWYLSSGATATCAISAANSSDTTRPGLLECWGSSTGGAWVGPAVYEVACSSWGCMVSQDDGAGGAETSFAVSALAIVPMERSYVLGTYAGSGVAGFNNDVGTAAEFNAPTGIDICQGEDVIADKNNQVLRRIHADRGVETLVGLPGVPGSVDDADPTVSTLSAPTAVGCGNFEGGQFAYSSDGDTFLLRRSILGMGAYIAAGTAGTSSPSTDGLGGAAIVGLVTDIRFDGTWYFVDATNQQVRAVDAYGTVLTLNTVGFDIYSMVLDPSRRLIYVGGNYSIWTLTYDGTDLQLFAGNPTVGGSTDGIATVARFNGVTNMDRDSVGNIYVVDSGNTRIRKISPQGEVVTVYGWTPGDVDAVGTNARMGQPWGLRLFGGDFQMHITDPAYNKVRSGDIHGVLPNGSIAIVDPVPPAPSPSPTRTPSRTPSPSPASPSPLAAAGSSDGGYKPDMFAAALTLGLLAVAFILLLLFLIWRHPQCAACCCGCCGAGAARRRRRESEQPPPPPAAAADKGVGHRLVINLDGAEDAEATRASKAALNASITVSSVGGGFVVFTGDKLSANV